MGVNGESLLGRNFGFGGTFALGPDYGELSGSVLGLLGIAASQSISSSNDLFFAILIPFLVENPCVHFSPAHNHSFGLSLNLLKFRYVYEKDSYYYPDNLFGSGSITFTYTIFGKKDWQWSVFAEGTTLYYPGTPKGYQFGVAFKHLNHDQANDTSQ